MCGRDKRAQRKYWKISKQTVRKNRAEMDKLITPPNSPVQTNLHIPEQHDSQSRQLSYSRKKIRRQKGKCYRDNVTLKFKLDASKKKAEMYRKRWMRIRDNKKTDDTPDTPRTKTRKQLRALQKQ